LRQRKVSTIARRQASEPESSPEESSMKTRKSDGPEPVPLGQRLFDRPFLLLAAGILVMLLFYTGWGLVEIYSLPAGTLP
jgi:hypothetical protein